MVKVWQPDTASWETYTDANFEDFDVVDDLKLRFCQSLKEQFPQVRLLVEPDYPPADYFVCGSMDLVSHTLMNILILESEVKAEFFPVVIVYRDEIYAERQFFYMNILDKVDCFDFDNSIYSVDEEVDIIESIDKLVLHPVDLTKHKLFYVAKIDVPVLCIANSLAEKIVRSGCTGVKFFDHSEIIW
jgi:hypothetical protein